MHPAQRAKLVATTIETERLIGQKQVDKLKQADEQSISDPWRSEDKIHADRLATCRGSDKPKQQPEAREQEEKCY